MSFAFIQELFHERDLTSYVRAALSLLVIAFSSSGWAMHRDWIQLPLHWPQR